MLTTTDEHPFYVKKTYKARDALPNGDDEDGEWLTAAELKVGQKVLRPDGLWTRITAIEQSNEPTLVYNFEVEDNHNYFVGETGVLSHNCNFSGKLALGLDTRLDKFASETLGGASTMKGLSKATPDAWKEMFVTIMNNGKNPVYFNLDGVNVWQGVQRAASGAGGATDWELFMIRQNPQWWDNITFMENGKVVPNPFK